VLWFGPGPLPAPAELAAATATLPGWGSTRDRNRCDTCGSTALSAIPGKDPSRAQGGAFTQAAGRVREAGPARQHLNLVTEGDDVLGAVVTALAR